MGERERLSAEQAKWMVKKQEAESRLRALGPKGTKVSGGAETECWEYNPEEIAEIESVEREIQEAKAKLKEIRQKLSKLPRQQE